MQSVWIAKTGSQAVRPNVTSFMGKVECKKYHKAFWNSMMKEEQMQVCKLCKQQDIKPAMKQTSTDARVAALEAKLRITSQPEEDDANKKEREAPQEPSGENQRESYGDSPGLGCKMQGIWLNPRVIKRGNQHKLS